MVRIALIGRPPGALAVRLVAIAAAAVLLVPRADPAIVAAGCASYALVAILLALVETLSRERWAPYAGAFLDAAALGVLVAAAGDATPPGWALGVLALALVAPAGYLALTSGTVAVALAAVAGGLTAADVAAVDALVSGGVLFALGAALLLLLGHFRRSAREAEELRAFLRAARRMEQAREPGEIAAAIVESARRLAQSSAARLWRREGLSGPFRAVATAGDPGWSQDALTEQTLDELAHGKQDGAQPELDALPGRTVLLPLPRHGDPRALLALTWRQRHRRTRDGGGLRRLADWAADALARAEAVERRAQASRRERVLREALMRFAQSSTVAGVERATVEAAAQASEGKAAIVEQGSGHVRSGDAALGPGGGGESLTLSLGMGLSLRVQAPGSGTELAGWLGELARAAGGAWHRCAEQERQRTELELLRAAIEWLPAPVVLQDGEGHVLAGSRAFDALGIDPPDLEAHEAPFEVTTGEPSRHFVAATARIEGECHATLYREVTQERAALVAKDELIATLGHELRTPLTSVRGYSQIMSRNLDVVREQIARLDAMIEDFVRTAQLQETGHPIYREMLDPVALVEDAARRFRGAWEGRELSVSVAHAPLVAGNSGHLGQVLDNLLGNAAKYSPAHTPIELSVRVPEGRVLIAVRDRGEGIAPEHLPHLFERSYRAPGATEPGQGLGLAIVHDLVAAHGGEVWAESAGPGTGSTFTVSLPAAEGREVPEAGVRSELSSG